MFLIALLVGLLLLVAGAELVVRGGGQLALALRVPALVVGLTIVAFGTSTPELAVSTAAALSGAPDMALANVVGSNIANLALVLGLAAIVRPLDVDPRLARRELPVLLVLQLLLPLFAWDMVFQRWEGAALLAVGIGYNVWLVWEARARRARLVESEEEEELEPSGPWYLHLALLVGGVAVIVFGADLFVGGATEVAERLGMSERYIGLTVVAVGTSAPEIATSVMSSFRNNSEIAMGNALGSNVLNVTVVLALSAMILPISLKDAGVFTDLWVALGATALLVPMVLGDRRISRWEGALLTGGYLAYVVFTPQ